MSDRIHGASAERAWGELRAALHGERVRDRAALSAAHRLSELGHGEEARRYAHDALVARAGGAVAVHTSPSAGEGHKLSLEMSRIVGRYVYPALRWGALRVAISAEPIADARDDVCAHIARVASEQLARDSELVNRHFGGDPSAAEPLIAALERPPRSADQAGAWIAEVRALRAAHLEGAAGLSGDERRDRLADERALASLAHWLERDWVRPGARDMALVSLVIEPLAERARQATHPAEQEEPKP